MGYSIPIVPKISTSGFMKPSQEADVNKGDVPKVSSSSEQRERSKSRQDGGECDAPNANPNSSGEKQDDGVIGQPQKPPTVGYSSHLLSKTYRTPSVAQGDSRTLVPAKPTAPAVKQDKASAPASEGPGKIKSDIYAAFFEEARASALKEYQQVQSDGNDQSTGGQGNVSSSKRKAHPSEANTDLAYKHPRLEQSVESSPAIAEKFIDQAGNVSSVVVPEIPSSTGATEIVRTETASCPSVVANELDGQVKTNTAHISGIDPPLQVQVTEEKEGPHPETVAGNLPKDVVDLTVEEEGDRLQIKQERADHPATWEGDGGDVDDNERQSLLRVEAGRTEVEVETP